MHGRQPLRIATRATRLARAQADEVVRAIRREFPDTPLEVVELATAGDELPNVPLSELGVAGIFVTELERALQAGEADMAVHSAKDLPTRLPEGLAIGAVLPRLDAADALVTREGLTSLDALRPGARVGTSSARRRALLMEMRPDLEIVPLRGSVETRLAKLDAGEVAAAVLAAAGLRRLGLDQRLTCLFDEETFIPMAGQGIIAVEVRQGEQGEICQAISHRETMDELLSEREFLARCGAGCQAPIGVRGWLREREILTKAVIADPAGRLVYRSGRTAPRTMAKLNGKLLADMILAAGGKDVVAAWKKTVAAAPVA